nr:amidohydrolase family protein [Cytophagales bacterium]
MKVIDSHQHFWKFDPKRLPWITDSLSVLKRDFLPDELYEIYREHAVSGCVAVQAAQTTEESHFLLDLAAKNEFVLGVVGWIDIQADNLSDQLQAFSSFKKLKGFRHILQDEADDRFICRPAFQRGLEIILDNGYCYDVLIYPRQLKGALDTIAKFPEGRFVIDHLAKPDIKGAAMTYWRDIMKEFKGLKNVSCKVSGMVTEHDWKNWQQEDFFPYLDVVMDTFGEDRIMFGSDWPVCLLAAPFGEVKEILEKYLMSVSPSIQAKIWAENAISFYKLDV